MSLRVVLPASAFLLFTQAVSPQPVDGFYVGTFSSSVRTLDVGLSLSSERGVLTGTYFYFGTLQEPIVLKGTVAAGQTIRLEESVDGKVTGRWAGKAVGNKLEGIWTNVRNARQWTFALSPADQDASHFVGPPRTMETGSGPVTFREARVPTISHRVPLVTAFRDRRVMSEINARVMRSADLARCDPPSKNEHGFEADVSFAGANLLSVRILQSWMCGAPYPTEGADRSFVYDIQTAREVSFDGVFRKDATKQQIATVLFPYELSRAREAKAPKISKEGDSGCVDEWSLEALVRAGLEPYFHLTGEGLVVQLSLPHVIAVCANSVTVPYAALAAIAAPNGPLARLAKTYASQPLRYRIHRPGTLPKDDVFYTPGGK